MGYDYALVHLKFNIPPAIALSFLCRPLLTRLDLYRISFLITIAVLYTIPWDSYLIRTKIWSYPQDVIIGPTLYDIPLEEVFFFVIQTYNTSLLYLLLSKTTLHPTYLRYEEKGDKWRYYKLFGQMALVLGFKRGLELLKQENEGTYMALILLWAIPILVLLWGLAYQFILGLPLTSTLLPIALPTLYLWVVDTMALQRGTWVIESGTKLGIHVWPHLEIEEAVFFLITNTLVVWGLIAFDNAVAILDAFPFHFPKVPALPSPVLLVRALLLPSAAYDSARIAGLQEAANRLSLKSRSFWVASGAFYGRLRVDLIMLYSYCRVADDLIDDAQSTDEAKTWVKKLSRFLDLCYESKVNDQNIGPLARFVVEQFPKNTHAALLQLPTNRLSPEPLYDLLKGFEMDLQFQKSDNDDSSYPIKTDDDLDLYCQYVAGTIGQLCLEHCFYHYPGKVSEAERKSLISAGGTMGKVLQTINIARDIEVDASLGRIYIPTAWLKKEKLTPAETIKMIKSGALRDSSKDSNAAFAERLDRLRMKLLDHAFVLYEESRPAIERLPTEFRASMRVTVESYVEIGRTMRRKGYVVKRGRATVPKWRRFFVAWKALSQ
ncbi:Lycopene beta-cyclase [Myriangium duriaei CBS 260.36]|uniref:Bifunctional lycopene cyclase/phytoene synthase n=1 Tax=Myriangium duriaei CBS 260.36 TaxID=1168546 RepID=A0A9P4J9A9_9PEZI|nr:Lycopene beta-cyclase [Myriangium duriaei CBS 260.36]